MKFLVLIFALLCTFNAFAAYSPRRATDLGFPVYTNKPLGRQLSGAHAPATTDSLSPEETRKKIAVPPGFEVRLFSAEPEVVNPVAMTWDERGRLWVLELYEYPKGAAPGEKGRDRIKIFEDTDNDGDADTVKVWADGFSLAEGFILGNGGVYLGAPPNLYFLRDTNNDDQADTQEVVLTGFGADDRHELLNGFAWGPDGWLYMTHGVFTYSMVRNPNDPNDDGAKMDAAVARFNPQTKEFEVFADGTSNPWGVDWNAHGDAFVEACVIHHLFHMAPGGLYNRQGGTWPNPYGYVQDLPSKGLPAIVDWRHYRAAHAGICVYQGNQWPSEWRGLVFLGNIHENAVNTDRLTPVGSTYQADREIRHLGPYQGPHQMGGGTFFASADPWVMPVSVQTGPDGALWVMDWYDRYPCYQNAMADPDGVDREHGRIWRVVWTGNAPGKPVPSRPSLDMDLKRLDSKELVALLDHDNIWQRRQAQRLLRERERAKAEGAEEAEKHILALAGHASARLEARLAAVWSLPPEKLGEHLDEWAADSETDIRVWAARYTGQAKQVNSRALDRLRKLASDPEPRVRAAAAVALRQFTAGSLTVNRGSPPAGPDVDLTAQFQALLNRPSVEGDFYYPHIVWMAMEPRVAANPKPMMDLLAANPSSVSAYCARRIMRRICDLVESPGRAENLNSAMTWLGMIAGKTELVEAALDGLIEAQKSKGAPPTLNMEPILTALTANPAVADKAQRLASTFGDERAQRMLVARINDGSATPEERLRGVAAAREAKSGHARNELLNLIRTEGVLAPEWEARLKTEAVQALAAFGQETARDIVDHWKFLPLPARIVAAESLVRSTRTARTLLGAVERGAVPAADISATARRALAKSDDGNIVRNAERLLGKYRQPGADKLKLIEEKKKVALNGQPDYANGYQMAKTACFVCHKLYGEGADVGPELTGVGRSTLDALLHNVIDPNEVIGNGYETTEVVLKDDTTLTGRLVEETDTRIKLLASGPTEHTIAKTDIKMVDGRPAVRRLELSLMPEGLEQIPDKDFRDMIQYILNPPQERN